MSIGDIDDDGFEVQLYREHAPDVGREKYWSGPAVWWGSETRMGSDGHEWVRSGLRLVCDDFGNLVSVR